VLPVHSIRISLQSRRWPDRLELREVDLTLLARRRLEANLEVWIGGCAHVAQEVGELRVAAGIAEILQLAQIAGEWRQQRRPGLVFL
jgi:hypothetical protein